MAIKLNKTIEKWDSMWYHTNIPQPMVDSLLLDIKEFTEESNNSLEAGSVGPDGGIIDPNIRSNKIGWLDTSHWSAAFVHYFICKANENNFMYDISDFTDDLQITVYEPGEYYHWHVDGGIINPDGTQRKLSFSLQLSDPNEYEGGELQFQTLDGGTTYNAPKEVGTLIVFDSRIKHRVTKVLSGKRLALVGWVGGPRWR
jgi:PKHD-type hydroxylase